MLLQTPDPITGEPAISMQTYRDRMGEDDEVETQRNELAKQRAMQAQAMQAAMMPQPEAKPGKEPPQNGNGHGRFAESNAM